MKPINASETPQTDGAYAQAILVERPQAVLYVSGQIPVSADGEVPEGFEAQARLVWRNIGAQLEAAGMDWSHVAKVTTFLGDRLHRDDNSRIRREMLGAHQPALTVIVCDIYDPRWLLEIEVVAMR